MDKEEQFLVYAAGFFDGEGCIHIARNVRAILGGCFVPGLLDEFARRWGSRLTVQRRSAARHRDCIRWEVTGPNAVAFLRAIRPYLREKAEQADTAIRFHELKRSMGVRGGRGYSAEQRAQLSALSDRNRELKHAVHEYMSQRVA